MKKGITPIVATIILLLITVALAGMAWAFLQGYFTNITGKNVQISDSFCMSGTNAVITVANIGTDTVTLTGCSGSPNPITGPSKVCGDVTITKSQGGDLNGNFSASNIAPKSSVVISDVCTTAGTQKICSYRITTSGAAVGPNVATVTCTG